MKVLFHIDEFHKWNLLDLNVKNILEEDPSLTVAVVVNSEAVELFTRKRELVKGVTYYLCQNALNMRKVDAKTLMSELVVVPSGVYQIALLEESGYHYIKP